MALNVQLEVFSSTNTTGNKTISLAANFDPKAIIVWGTPQTADGTAASYLFSYGYATYRSSAVVQRAHYIKGLDAQAIADTSYGYATDAVLVHYSTAVGSATRDVEIDLVSMATGATSNVILNVVNAHASAIRIFVLILGGSDITDALVGDMTTGTASATVDETVVAGFGKPDLVFFGCTNDAGALDAAGDACISYGFAKQGEAGRMQRFAQTDGNTASIVAAQQRGDRCIGFLQNGGGSSIFLGRLETTVASWPTDGFRMLLDATSALNAFVSYLALRGTFQSATGETSAPTSGSPPVTQDNAAGFVPKLGYLLNWSRIASTAIATADTTAADLVSMGIGAYDGTTDAWAGWTEDDAALTMVSKSAQVNGKVIRQYSATPTLQGEADGVFSGNNFRLSWTTVPGLAGSYQWLALGDAAAGGTNWTQPVNDTVTMADATAFDRGLVVPDTVTMADALAFVRDLHPADTITLADALAFDRAIQVADTLTLADAVAAERGLAQLIADTLTLADNLGTETGKGVSIADTLTLADALAFDRALTVADAITPTDALAFQRAITIADLLGLADLASPVKTGGATDWTQAINDTIALADQLAFQRALVLADVVSLADVLAVAESFSLSVADTVALVDAVTTLKTVGTPNTSGAVSLADVAGAAAVLVDAVAAGATVADVSGASAALLDVLGGDAAAGDGAGGDVTVRDVLP